MHMDTPTANLPYYEAQLPLLKETIEQFETASDRIHNAGDFAMLKEALNKAMALHQATYAVFLQGRGTITTRDWQDVVNSYDHLNRYFQSVLQQAKLSIDHLITQADDAGMGNLVWGELITLMSRHEKDLQQKEMLIPYQHAINRDNAAFFLRHLDRHLNSRTLLQMHRDQSTSPLFTQFAEQFAASISAGDIHFALQALQDRITAEQDLDALQHIKARMMNEYYATLLGLKLRLQPYADTMNLATSQVFIALNALDNRLQELQSLADRKITLLNQEPEETLSTESRPTKEIMLENRLHELALHVSAHRLAIGQFAEAQTMSKEQGSHRSLLKRLFDALRGKRQKPYLPNSPFSLEDLQDTQAELKSRLAILHGEVKSNEMRETGERIFGDLVMMGDMIAHLTPKVETQSKPINLAASYQRDRERRGTADLLISTGPKQTTFQFDLPRTGTLHTVPPNVRKYLQRLMRDEAPNRLFISGKDPHLVELTKEFAKTLHEQGRCADQPQYNAELHHVFAKECQETRVASPAA